MYGLSPYSSAAYSALSRSAALMSISLLDTIGVTDLIGLHADKPRAINSTVGVTDHVSLMIVGPARSNGAEALSVTHVIAFTIVRGPNYVSNASGFPGANWDGSSATRKNPNVNGETALNVYREPDANDWQRVQNEVIAVEVQLQTNTTTLTTTSKIAGANNSAAIATTATAGFGYLPTCAGTPTGVPAATPTGYAPCVYDTTAHKLWVYDAGWKTSGALA